MSAREKIIEFITANGPILPVQIAKEINSDILIASAHLSELVSNKELKVSHLKVGGSPLYFLPGQESNLQKFSDKLHEKEKKAYELLSDKKILKESDLDPVVKVFLKNIKDFAVPLQVNHGGGSEIFWKWYLLPGQEAEKLIKSKLVVEPKEEKQKKLMEKVHDKKIPEAKEPKITKEIKPIKEPEIKKEPRAAKELPDQFFKSINNYFNKNNIKIKEQNIIRKGSEAEFTIELPSAVGQLTYYCKAKSKKKINEGDLSAVFITGQSKKLPVLLLTKGELTKKAREMLEKEFKGMSVKKV